MATIAVVDQLNMLTTLDETLNHSFESNMGNPAARAYIGTSAAAGSMVTWIMRLYEGYGDLYIPQISGSWIKEVKELRYTSSH